MRSPVSSPASSSPRNLGTAWSSAAGLVAVRRPGVRPPSDVRQTCALMLCVAPAYGLLAYLAGDRMSSAQPEGAVGLGVLMVVSVLSGLALAALAVPVRRGGSVLWRAAQVAAVVAMGTALFGLHMAAQGANTLMVAVAAAVAVAAIAVNIALWSIEVRRWCAP